MAKTPETEHPVKAFGWASKDTSGIFSPFNFSRRATGERDVQFKILYCGICHSDFHMGKNDWGITQYPIVPGHEIAGVVTEVGSKVEKYKIGDKVGVGGLAGSCGQCDQCSIDLESYCPKQIWSFNSVYHDGTITYGGFSDIMVADESFIIRWPENLPQNVGAPLLCAGITMYSPLRYFGLDKPGLNVGIVGLGGLGHVGVKFAKALGAKVTIISTSASKKNEAIEHLGADEFLVSTDPEQMQAAASTLDGIIDTVSAVHPLGPLLSLLKPHTKLIMVGNPGKPVEVPIFPILSGRKEVAGSSIGGIKETQEMIDFAEVAGSSIGGIKETQEMIDFAAKHNIFPDVEMIPMDYVNTAMERLVKSDVKYRFVIDVAKSLKSE